MGASLQIRNPQLSWDREVKQRLFYLLCSFAPGLMSRALVEQFLTPQRRPDPPKEPQFQAGAQRVSIGHEHLQLAGYVWGDGPTVLLVHGWEARASSLRAFVSPLVQRGFRVVALDLPAHGASPGTQTNLIDSGRTIRTAMARFGPVYGVVAHSFGAAATMLLLGWQHDLRVQRAVLIGAPAELMEMMLRWTRAKRLPEPVIGAMQRRLEARFGEAVETFSIPTVAASLKTTGMVVHDRQDPMASFSGAEAIVKSWTGARLLATDGLGHRGPLRSPKVIREVVAFLAEGRPS